ncbi:PVC-type heme-binding CxxCH protein [Aureliella helgolandensis]|uniref:Cytochrome c n=1 Tax=Aureliella helgolandensis TaxID=2527968 RepID=A0A518G8C1_9BACT|nr:PVC-type heme-binding CxxCH protein [Aureliella helgolandensis]QDV24838.1 Cytochrome c [Aureliella helgolandensis]
MKQSLIMKPRFHSWGLSIAAIVVLTGHSAILPAAEERAAGIEILQPGVRLTIVAEHPEIVTPTGLDVDAEGRVWAVACHTHLRPEDYQGTEFDEILVFDPDGAQHVFYNKTEQTMDLELGPDGWVYLSERDRILRVKDSDADGVGDTEQTLVELDSEAVYPHNALSGLAWTPQGDLIFGLGENFAKPWTLTALDGSTIRGIDRGGIFRLTAHGEQLHKIAEGLWNPFGVTVRDDGEIFVAENDPGEYPPCKVLHIVQDGDYGYRRKYGSATPHPFVCWNGELRGTLPMIHPSGEAPCGVVPLGRGLLMPSWGDHRIDYFALEQEGASFTAQQVTLVRGSRYFRPTCIVQDRHRAKNGTLVFYLTDWVDGRYPVHGYGRLWKLEIDPRAAAWTGPLDVPPATSQAKLAESLRRGTASLPQADLLELSRNADRFVGSAALSSLSRLADEWTPAEFSKWTVADRVQAVQALRLATVDPQPWIDALLEDDSPGVQFETLRWLADEDLRAYLPSVESLLGNSHLSYEVFEAAVAAHTALSGQPEIGMRNPDLLLARVQDDASSPAIRAFALRLLPIRSTAPVKDETTPTADLPEGLSLPLLKKLLAVQNPALSIEVVRVLGVNPAAFGDLLAKLAADDSKESTLRAEAIVGLAAIAESHLPLLLQLTQHRDGQLREEALRALRGTALTAKQKSELHAVASQHPESDKLVTAILDPSSLTLGRAALDDTAAWSKRLAAIRSPADPVAGERIFHHAKVAQCAHCHRVNGRGNVGGPDLSHIGGRDEPDWLLGAILQPNRELAPQFMPRAILLKDGSLHVGIRLRSYVYEQIRDALGRNHTFNRDDVESIEDLTTSFMPTGLPLTLTDRELRDLLAFLEQNQ